MPWEEGGGGGEEWREGRKEGKECESREGMRVKASVSPRAWRPNTNGETCIHKDYRKMMQASTLLYQHQNPSQEESLTGNTVRLL